MPVTTRGVCEFYPLIEVLIIFHFFRAIYKQKQTIVQKMYLFPKIA
jgi:hypothetical protein